MSNHTEEFVQGKEHSNLVDRYYKICEVFGDDLRKVATAIRQAGAEQRPSFIAKDIEYLWIDKYSEQINYIHDLFTYDYRAAAMFSGMINALYRCGVKYKFDPIHEVKKGEILKVSNETHTIKQPKAEVDKKNPTLNFGEGA